MSIRPKLSGCRSDDPGGAVEVRNGFAGRDGTGTDLLDLGDDLRSRVLAEVVPAEGHADVIDHDCCTFAGQRERELTAQTAP